ncbi:MAG: fluoride efflux transporter CrcB [Lachnospiraceae bacterium]|nr:fluoride efflux transporter CrcB [Lachnospiraceae bacterium]
MIKCLIVGAGGAIGAIGRYLIGLLPMNPENGFPVKTFLINVIGCFIIGIIAALADKNAVNPNLVLLIKVGICGGFTTFSSFALETEGLIAKGSTGVALMYVILSLICGVLAVFAAEKMVGTI